MPRCYLYSNCLGSFLIDEKMQVQEKLLFGDDFEEKCSKLAAGEWLAEELELAAKAKGDKFYIGNKSDKKGWTLTEDSHKIELVSRNFTDHAELRARAFIIARNSLKKAMVDDVLIIQTICCIDDLDKSINLLCKRTREWYDIYNPEFSRSISDHGKFLELMLAPRKELLLSLGLTEKESIGATLEESDISAIFTLAREISQLQKLRQSTEQYLGSIMRKTCPNVDAVAGSLIGARLLGLAGSMERFSSMAASKIQLLGAEKALFRHLRNRNLLPPKYGVIFAHQLIQQASRDEQGKVARSLADKISIAAKVDYFKGEFIGDQLRKDLERKFSHEKAV